MPSSSKVSTLIERALGNPYVNGALGAIDGYATGALVGAVANTILPDQYDINPNWISIPPALLGAYSGYRGESGVGKLIKTLKSKPQTAQTSAVIHNVMEAEAGSPYEPMLKSPIYGGRVVGIPKTI